MTEEEIHKKRVLMCKVFGFPLSILKDIDKCVVLGQRNLEDTKKKDTPNKKHK